jgi:hypothetical protein
MADWRGGQNKANWLKLRENLLSRISKRGTLFSKGVGRPHNKEYLKKGANRTKLNRERDFDG